MNLHAGSEINFFMQAPSGDWKFFFSRQMKKSGRQKAVCKIFVKKQRNIPFHLQIGFTFGWVFIRSDNFSYAEWEKGRLLNLFVCLVKQNKLFFVYDLFY